MKRAQLIRHLTRHGCKLVREGRSHSLWGNPELGTRAAVPRHQEINNQLAREICKQLEIPRI